MSILDPKPLTKAAADKAYTRTIPGVVADNVTDNRAAIQAALDLGGAWKLPATTGTYLVNGELNVTVAGTSLDATGAPIRQGTNGMALFNVTVPDVTIDGVDAQGTTSTLNTTGMTAAWEMSITASRWTVINAYKGADRLRVPWIRGRGFSSVVRVTNWDKAAGSVAATRVMDAEIGTLLCSNVEFGLVFQGTERLSWNLIKGSYIYPTGGTRGPHLIYSSGTTGDNRDLNGGAGIATFEGGANGQAFQLKGVQRGTVRSLEANACPGFLTVMDCTDLHIGTSSSRGDTCTDAYASIAVSANTGTLERVSFGSIKMQMVNDAGIPYRQTSGTGVRINDMDAEVNHTTSGDGSKYDVSITGAGTEIERLKITNIGTASWRGLGILSGDGHRVSRYKATNVRVGVEVRTAVTNATISYDQADVTLHATDGYEKIMVSANAAPTLRLPGKPSSTSRTKVLDTFALSPDSGTAFGPALTGQAWTVQTGTWVADQATNEAYESASASQSNAYVDAGIANVEVRGSVKLKAYDGFMLRRVSATEYVCVYMTLAGVVIAKRDTSLITLVSGPAVTYQAGRWYSLRVQIYGAKIDVYVDNVFSVSHTLTGGDETKFGTSTLHGLFCSASTGANRFKDFEIIQL